MKKLFLLLMVVCLLCPMIAAHAETPAGYPEVKIDPATGKPYDLGGRSVYIYDFWTNWDWHTTYHDTEQEKAQFAYRTWIEKTYNCKVYQTQRGDWNTCAEEFIKFYKNPEDSLSVFIIEPGKVAQLINNNYAADWNRSLTVDVSNQGVTSEFTSVGDSTYGASTDANEPGILLYFNKDHLEAAGIDWNVIYDMQRAKTWTWDAFEKLLKQTQRDTDNDGVIDVYGLTGSSDLLYRISVFSNGGDYFHYDENDQLSVGVNSEKSLAALNWAQNIWQCYAYPQPEGANWDYYVQAWNNGISAFYISQYYAGFYGGTEMPDVRWGSVAFPMGPEMDRYVTTATQNTALIPNVYDDKELSMLTLIYDLWMSPTPGYENSWLDDKNAHVDDRAWNETYVLLREPANMVADLTTLLGTTNDVLGVNLLWSLNAFTPAELVEAGLPVWQEMCNDLNEKRELTIDLSGLKTLTFPEDLTAIEANAFENTGAVVVEISEGCTSIGARAFANCDQLSYVVIPKSVTSISPDAFEGCDALQRVLVYRKSYASQFCWENGLTCLYLVDQQPLSLMPRMWTISLD